MNYLNFYPIELAQAQDVVQNEISLVWEDDFRDFKTMWSGDVSNFTADISQNPIRLNQISDSGNGKNSIFRSSSIFFGKWEFSIHFDGFTTSNQNRATFWLIKSSRNEPGGVGVRVGENGSNKRIRIIQIDESGSEELILSSNTVLPPNTSKIEISVTHHIDGEWELSYRFNDEVDVYSDTIIHDFSTIKKGKWMGITTEFTRTRVDKFAFGPITFAKIPLFLERIDVRNNALIHLIFSEILPDHYITELLFDIDSYNGSIQASNRDQIIELDLSNPLTGGRWILNINGLYDPDLHLQYDPFEIEFSVTDQAELFDIIINEFMPRPLDNAVFIELLNVSSKHVNLKNWTIGIGSQSRTIEYDQSINPGDIILLGTNESVHSFNESTHFIELSIPPIPKTQGSIWIKSDDQDLIDSVRYDNNWSDIIHEGFSLEKINPMYIGMDVQNWTSHPNSSSYGYENVRYDPSNIDLTLLSAVADHDSLYIRFSHFLENINSADFTVNGVQIIDPIWTIWQGNELKFHLNNNSWIQKNQSYLDIEYIKYVGDSIGHRFSTEIAHPPVKGDLSINEILYHPIKDRYSSYSDQSEFIEIKNHRPYKISLNSIKIRDGVDKFGKYRSWIPKNSLDWIVMANDYAVIFADTTSVTEDAQLLQFFGVEPDSKWGHVSSSTLGLTTSGREIILSDYDGNKLDSVYYSPDMHHPLVRETKGRSLEKIESLSTTTGSKWTTSAHILGATPGTLNSNNIPDPNIRQESELIIHPNPFSPDYDGVDDITVIELALDEPEYLLRMSIFDRYGYKVNDLIKDKIIGTNFSTFWDGTDSSGNLLGTGVYIVWISAIHFENKTEHNYKKPLVLVRKK